MSKLPDDTSPDTFSKIFDQHQGRMIDKWEQYLEIYQSELATIQLAGKPVALLEIGVQNGGSLEMWKAFLPAGSNIVGVDIDPRCGEMRMPDGITILIGNAADPAALSGLNDKTFDIIIDDGSHLPDDVRRSFDWLLNHLRPGGLYFVEDVHCSYASSYGGGLMRCNSAAEWGKTFVDALNFDYIEPSDRTAIDAKLPWFNQINRCVERISFYDSAIVIKRKRQNKVSAYSRILGGGIVHIDTTRTWWNELTPESRRNVRLTDVARRELIGDNNPSSSDIEVSSTDQNDDLCSPGNTVRQNLPEEAS